MTFQLFPIKLLLWLELLEDDCSKERAMALPSFSHIDARSDYVRQQPPYFCFCHTAQLVGDLGAAKKKKMSWEGDYVECLSFVSLGCIQMVSDPPIYVPRKRLGELTCTNCALHLCPSFIHHTLAEGNICPCTIAEGCRSQQHVVIKLTHLHISALLR